MDESKKFTLTRGKLILLVLLAVIVIVCIIIFIPKGEKYSTSSFEKLESNMAEEAKQYIVQEGITIKESEERRVTLEELIEAQSILDTEITDLCTGYVILKKEGSISSKAYISCGKYYISDGYKKITEATTSIVTTSSVDTSKPVIKLKGSDTITINQNTKFTDPGFIAYDDVDGELTSEVIVTGTVNITKPGSYTIYYNVKDSSNNSTQVTRTVIVSGTVVTTSRRGTTTKANTTTRRQTTPPTIILKGDKQITLRQYDKYSEPGYTALDSAGNSLTSKVIVTGTINTVVPGTYSRTYSVTDSSNNTTRVVRTIIVVADTTVELKSISVQRNAITLTKGGQYQVIVYFTPSNATNKALSWSSNNTSVATVSGAGLIKAIGTGTAIIKTTAKDGNYTAYTIVTVTNTTTTTTKTTTKATTTTTKTTTRATTTVRLKGISFLKTAITINKGQQYQVVVYYNPSNATNKTLTWSSNNKAIATVSSTGIIKGIAKGKTTIKAVAKDGNYTASVIVTVQ